MTIEPIMTVDDLNRFLDTDFPQVHTDGKVFHVTAVGPGFATMRLDPNERHIRPGGTVSGPTLFALADVSAYIALIAHIGPVALAVTTNLNINFLRKGQPGQDVLAEARLLKLGKRLAVGEVNLLSGTSPDPIAHVTSTYSIPNV